jgi:hypothetical protein
VRELRAGLWHWQASHPDWTPEERWPQAVSSYGIDDGARLLLVDPLAVPQELLELAADREPLVVLTAPWHERDTRRLVERSQRERSRISLGVDAGTAGRSRRSSRKPC